MSDKKKDKDKKKKKNSSKLLKIMVTNGIQKVRPWRSLLNPKKIQKIKL